MRSRTSWLGGCVVVRDGEGGRVCRPKGRVEWVWCRCLFKGRANSTRVCLRGGECDGCVAVMVIQQEQRHKHSPMHEREREKGKIQDEMTTTPRAENDLESAATEIQRRRCCPSSSQVAAVLDDEESVISHGRIMPFSAEKGEIGRLETNK